MEITCRETGHPTLATSIYISGAGRTLSQVRSFYNLETIISFMFDRHATMLNTAL